MAAPTWGLCRVGSWPSDVELGADERVVVQNPVLDAGGGVAGEDQAGGIGEDVDAGPDPLHVVTGEDVLRRPALLRAFAHLAVGADDYPAASGLVVVDGGVEPSRCLGVAAHERVVGV